MIAAAQYMVVPRTAAFPNGSSSIAAFGAAGNALRDNHFTNSSVTGSFTNIRNKWTLKVGGEYRAYLSNTFQSGTQSFAFAQAGALTTRCGGANCPQIPNSQAQGSGFAAMLMGAMEASGGGGQFQDGDPRVALKAGYMGLYTQNDWKATDRLTVNLGFRWEYQAPLTERYNRMAQFDPNAINTTGTMGTLTYSGVGGNGRGMTDSDHRNFAPRVGLAYRLDDKTVIRSAYGITYDMTTGIGQGSAGFGTTGFSAPSIMLIRPTTGPYVNQDMLDRPYNDPVVIGPTAVGPNASDPRNYLFGSLLQTVRKQLTPYVQQWNFTIERDLPGGINLSLSYVGSKGTRLPTQINRANEDYEVSPSILASAQQQYAINGTNPLLTMVANPFYGTIPSTVPNGAPTISRLQLSRPYPAYNTIWIMHWRLGTSSYESGQLTVRKHFHNGMEVGGNYVWSKNMSYGGGISAGVDTNMGGNYNNFGSVNRELETSVDGGDVPHRAVIYYSLDLPFGKGKPLLPATPVLSQLLGGWKVSGQTTFSSGVPLNVFRAFPARPDLVGDPVLSAQYRCQGPATCSLPDGTTVNVPAHRMLYFNPHAFSNRMVQIQSNGSYRDQIYWFGNAPRFLSNLRSAGINNWNMSLSREIKLSERARLEIRADATNAFNHTQWSPQGGTYGNNMGASNSQAGSSLGYGTDTTFGTVNTNNTALPRYMQIQARFVF